MNADIWYEEELLPPAEMLTDITKSLPGEGLERLTNDQVKGVVRIHTPRARPVTPEEVGELSGTQGGILNPGRLAQGALFLMRLGLEFDVADHSWSYTQAWCRANLFAFAGQIQPRLLDIYPQRLYEGQPKTVQVQAGPSLKAADKLEVSLGSINLDMHLGQVTPVTLGFLGEGERRPYWHLQERDKPIRGIYHFWLLVEQPAGCQDICMKMLGEGDLRTKRFTIPVGPKKRQWEEREMVRLNDILA